MATITQLRYALAVANAGHYAKAGELCNVSQTAISKGVSLLEEEIGFKLFEKCGAGSVKHFAGVTQHGRIFLYKAAIIVANFDSLIRSGK